jgi:DNA polymerase elongation subunit (family B)
MGIVTAETLMVKNTKGQEIPTIVLIGRTEQGEKKMWRTVFYPYLYLTEEDYMKVKVQDEYSISKYVKETEGVRARTLTKKALTKVYIKDSKYVTNLVHFLNKYNKVSLGEPMFTYEADLSAPTMLPIRFLIDSKIKSGVDITDTGNLIPIDMNIKLRKWYIDFEALSSKQGGHGPRKEESIPIVSYYDNYLSILYTLYVKNPKWKDIPKFHNLITDTEKHCILAFDSEALLLDALTTMVNDYDPDLFTAWNLDRYDIVKWTQRMIINNLDPKGLSPFHSFSWKRIPYRIKGRILFDLMKGFKRFTDAELRSYGLGIISEEENLSIEKIPLNKPTQWIWDNEPEILFKRNVNDVLIIKALDEKYDLVEMFDDLRREFGALFHEVLLNYRVLDTALMRFINDKIVLRTSFKAAKNKESYLGAVVIEPKPGQYPYVALLDFNREYPSMIKAFNIGPETYRGPDYKGPCYIIEYNNKIYKFVKRPRSLLAQLIDFFFNKRDEYEKLYQKAIEDKDEVKIKAWYRKVFNIKKMTNAIYGVMDYPSFRLYKQECSAATAALGRIGIEQIALIVKDYEYELIYGDTDSSFIPLKSRDKEDAVKEATELAEKINSRLSEYFKKTYGLPSAPTGLGVKKIYDSFLLIAKKNYAGKSFWDEKKGYKEDYDFKGLEAIRSDSSDVEKEVVENIVKLVLNGKGEDARIVGYGVLDAVKKKKFNPIDIAYPLQLKADFKEYLRPNKNGKVSVPSHIRAAVYSNMFLDTDYMKEDKPRRLPILAEEKTNKGQQALFSNEEVYPTEWIWEGQHFHLNGISITEDMEIPIWFINKINWQHIYERLSGKIEKIMSLVRK